MIDNENGRDDSRRGFLRTATVAVGAATVALGGPMAAMAQQRGRVKRIQLPDLYAGWNAKNFREIQNDENTHVQAVINTIQQLGGTPRPKPTFQGLASADVGKFAIQSLLFENTGVGAYLSAAPIIFNKDVLAGAAQIAFVEAYHSGYLNTLLNTPIVTASSPFAIPLSIDEIVRRASPFVASLNGGPAPTFNTTPSAENDIAILNFALLLEYLEAEFYNLNVPTFFG